MRIAKGTLEKSWNASWPLMGGDRSAMVYGRILLLVKGGIASMWMTSEPSFTSSETDNGAGPTASPIT